MAEENKIYNLETMSGIGKVKKIAGREYKILPVNIEDMHHIIGEDAEQRLYIASKEDIEKKEVDIKVFGHNVIGPKKEIFLKILKKYVYYLDKPMTENLLVEHNWSFKEIAEFMWFWIQDVSE